MSFSIDPPWGLRLKLLIPRVLLSQLNPANLNSVNSTLSLTPLFLGNSNKIGSEKGIFRLVTGVGRKKILSSHAKSNPTTFGFRAPMLYHWATGNLRWTRSITKFMWHASCILPWSAMSSLNMKATFAVMNTTWAVVKIRPEKKIQARTGFEPVTSAIPVSQRSWVHRFKYRIGLNFFQALFSLLLK